MMKGFERLLSLQRESERKTDILLKKTQDKISLF